jgi:hypothetical protein
MMLRKTTAVGIRKNTGWFATGYSVVFKGRIANSGLTEDQVRSSEQLPFKLTITFNNRGIKSDHHFCLYKGIWYSNPNDFSSEDILNIFRDHEKRIASKLAALRASARAENEARSVIPPKASEPYGSRVKERRTPDLAPLGPKHAMHLQNRVNPEGEICVSPARGTLMGNRGCLHNNEKKIISQSKRDAWVTCLLQFQNRKRQVMAPGNYTELFFLDEATALAAGHRPCATCRRDRYDAFLMAWSAANRGGAKVPVGDVDKQLKFDRAAGARARTQVLTNIPDGVMVKQESTGAYFLIRNAMLSRWSFAGYGPGQPMTSVRGPFVILTPASTLAAIRRGYRPEIHRTAR